MTSVLENAATARPSTGTAARRPIGEDQRQAFEEQVAGQPRTNRSWSSRRRAGDVQQAAALTRQPAGEESCGPRIEIGVARQAYVERLELPSSLEQHEWSLATAVLGKRDLGLQPIHAGSTEVIQGSGLGSSHQRERHIKGAGFEARLGGGQRAVCPTRGLLGQGDRALEKCSRGSETTPGLRSPGRLFELGGHGIVGTEHGLGAVPGTAIGVDLGIGDRGQCSMDAAALRRRRRLVDRRAQKRVPESDACVDLEQPFRLGGRRGCNNYPELGGRPPEQVGISHRVGRCQQQQMSRIARQQIYAAAVFSLDPAGQGQAARNSKPA